MDYMDVFVDVWNDVVVGIEELFVVYNNWCFFDLMYEIECFGNCVIIGGFVFDDFDQYYFVDRVKEVDVDELFRVNVCFGQGGDWQG